MDSPPCPTNSATALTVYRKMHALLQWTSEEHQRLATLVDQSQLQQLDDPPFLPEEEHCMGKPIIYFHAAVKVMREFRACWDEVRREYEDDWDGKLAVSYRLSLLELAIDLLGDLFNDTETLEARWADRLKRRETDSDAPDKISGP